MATDVVAGKTLIKYNATVAKAIGELVLQSYQYFYCYRARSYN